MKLKYGNEKLNFEIDKERIKSILVPSEKEGTANPGQEIKQALREPLAAPSLQSLLKEKNPANVVIIVNDISRPTPYEHMLPPLLQELEKSGINKNQITLVVATGIHDPHTEAQNKEVLGSKIVENYRIISHDPDNNLKKVGKLETGNTLSINREVYEADFVITTGVILPHYFAGFSGGRKSILPGVADRKTIEDNHAQMVDILGNLPPVEENKLSQEMIAGARIAGVDFILNVVTNSYREIVEVVAGDLEKAWLKGIETSKEMYYVSLDKKVEVAVVSAGGYPRDINMYQAQKALDHAQAVVKSGGTIILAAECREGLGENTFAHWLNELSCPEDGIDKIKNEFKLGGHKAFAICEVVKDKEFILISNLDQETTDNLYALNYSDLQKAIFYVEEKYNKNYEAVIMPEGSLTVPVIEKS